MEPLLRGLGILCFELGLVGLGATVIVPEPRALLPVLGPNRFRRRMWQYLLD
ncbi:hypothetical protein NJ7G_1028 [Natrinema sp. J7-2]|nr:hypothetical protein NJ7G_1028 [Natrinema sp. J7-2]